MENFNKFYFILGIFILIIQPAFSKSNTNVFSSKKENKSNSVDLSKLSSEDQYYLIFVSHENIYSNSSNDSNDNKKRSQEKEDYINSMVYEIHSLILENKDTYKNPEKLDELNNNSDDISSRKRDDQNKLLDNNESNFVYPISSLENESVLYAYLSYDVAKMVLSMPNIKACEQNSYNKQMYDKNEILQETKWKDVSIKKDTYNHLSLISQGKYNENSGFDYDTNYYYPSSGGKDIDIYVFDSNFNFNDSEFDKNDRSIKCAFNVTNGIVYKPSSENKCIDLSDSGNYHGTLVSDAAVGNINGAANRANLYGVYLSYYHETGFSNADAIRALEYIDENLLRPYKTIINMSFGSYHTIGEYKETEQYFQKVINKLSEKGVIFFASAGNEGRIAYDEEKGRAALPCAYDNVICVGGIENNVDGDKKMKNYNYKKYYYSNYGKGVNIYGPFFARLRYRDINDEAHSKPGVGTSFASPIAAGVAATIMSEFPEIEFTTEKMLSYLSEIGIKDAISGLENSTNILLNNGKHHLYPSDKKRYNDCGERVGKKCLFFQCCGEDGKCRLYNKDKDYCQIRSGCQRNYGKCD